MEELIEYLKKHIEICNELQNMKGEQKVLQLVLNEAERIAINYTHSCEKLVFEEGKKMYEKGWEDGTNHIYTECMPRNKN